MIRLVAILSFLLVTQISEARAPFVKFSEKLREKVLCDDLCGEVFSGAFTLQWQRPISSSLASSIGPGTEFVVRVQDFLIVRGVNEDPNYVPGNTSAEWTNHDINGKRSLTMKISWKNDQLSVLVKGRTPAETSPQAENLRNAPQPGLFAQSIDLLLRINQNGSTVWELDYANREMSAILKRKTRTVQGSPYELDKIRVFGGFIIEP